MNQPAVLKQAYPAISFQQATQRAEVIDIGLQKKSLPPLRDLVLQVQDTRAEAPHKIQTHFWILSVAAHMLALSILAFAPSKPTPIKSPAEPITVSLIAAPAPVIAPIIEPPREVMKPEVKKVVEPKPKLIPKKVVKTIVPVVKDDAPTIEATPEPVVADAPQPTHTAEPVASEAPAVAEVKAVQATKPAAPAAEIELPKFGVAYLNNPAPDYPGMSRRMGEEGRVLLKVLVSTEGNAESVQLAETSGSERLDQAAINAVKRWRFVPAQLAGKALSAYVLVPIKFSLDS